MKKIVSIALLLTLCVSLFAGCNKGEGNQDPTAPASSLKDAVAYLKGMYQTGGKDEAMVLITDKDVLSSVTVESTSFKVEWAITVTEGAADAVKIGESSKTNHVLIDIPERADSDIKFTATATAKDAEGKTESISFSYMVEGSAFGGMTDEEIVEQAYALEDGELMESAATLTGVVTRVKSPYSADYQNITVIIQIGDLEDKKIECYRLKGEGIEELCIGDTITVTGILKNYSGTIEFDAGCVADKIVPGDRVQAPEDPAEIVAAAYALEAGKGLPYSATLTGKVTEIDSPYSDQYGNISVVIEVGGDAEHPILCYRIKGTGADTLEVGDEITVVGYITNYNGTIEFESGSQLTAVVKGEGGEVTDPTQDPTDETEPTDPTDPEDPTDPTTDPTTEPTTEPTTKPTEPVKPATLDEQIAAAQALPENEKLSYTSTMTGMIVEIGEEGYSEEYQNITVTIKYNNKSYKVYRMKGEGADNLDVGDTITVTGYLQNYYGKVQVANGNLDSVKKGETAPTDPKAIVNAAYALAENTALSYQVTLTGVVTRVKTPYDAQYKNVTVIIQIGDMADKKIECYRLKGDGVDELTIGDTVTVTGILKNYNGTVEFDAGCVADKIVAGAREEAPATAEGILKAAYALESGKSLTYSASLTGKIIEIKTPYDSSYKNISVIIEVEGFAQYPILCYRMKGNGAENLKVGDTITVTGYITNYNGTIEYESGNTFVLN